MLSFFERIRFSRALKRELGADHALLSKKPKPVARSDRTDDVLFRLSDGGFACVHLTWDGSSTSDAPQVSYFYTIKSFLDFVAQDAAAEAAYVPALCEACGSNWSANEARADCATCAGYALFRPCPICGGACGATWERAVIDSNDQQEPVFVGSCRGEPERST